MSVLLSCGVLPLGRFLLHLPHDALLYLEANGTGHRRRNGVSNLKQNTEQRSRTLLLQLALSSRKKRIKILTPLLSLSLSLSVCLSVCLSLSLSLSVLMAIFQMDLG